MTSVPVRSARAPTPPIVRAILVFLFLFAAASQALILAQALAENPFARTPINDAAVYWQWAGEIARGRLVGATPYLSAPLYPHAIGLVRALGGDLLAVYALQACLHLATGWLLYRTAARRFEPAVGVLAVAMYFLLQEPAFFTGRVLNATLQAFLVAWTWDRMVAVQEDAERGARSISRLVLLAIVLGLDVLANPVMLVAVPIVAAWVVWISRGERRAVVRGIATAAIALALVVPATVHNWLACGELIPVCAQGGVTFYHGNSPGADGTYKPIPGISADRIKQNLDARELVAGETGGSWRGASAHFLDKGLAYWASDPAAAARLFALKLYWFVSGRNYGDIYLPALEIEEGFASRLAWIPLPVAWIALGALLVLAILSRASLAHAPAALLVLVPLATVAVFWYSPRYRFPAVPILCALAAAALVEILDRRGSRARRTALAASFAVALLLGPVNAHVRFDRLDAHRGTFQELLGTTLASEGRLDEALARYRKAMSLGAPDAAAGAGDVLRRLGRDDEALEALREAARLAPESAYAHRSLAVALAESGALDEARAEFEAALHADPNDWESMSGLGNVALRGGDTERAIARYHDALRANPSFASAHFNLGFALKTLGRADQATESFERALVLDPRLVAARVQLAELAASRGDFARAVRELRAALRVAPDDAEVANALAWHLATAPDDAVREAREALVLAEGLERRTADDPLTLDTLAAALAENGRFDDAERAISRAIARLEQDHTAEELSELAERRQLYRAHRPYRAGPR